MRKIVAIIGARPQFIKHAPLDISLRKCFEVVTIHTGQHYDEKMSNIFFSELGMRKPKYILNSGGGSHGFMTGSMMMEIEPIMIEEAPSAVLVYGDTNSTLAGALVSAKLNIPVIHVEAGLRSFNRNMPEEINRILTDNISTLLIAPTQSAVHQLKSEGIDKGVFVTGDVMLDTLKMVSARIPKEQSEEAFILMTLHRPYNVDAIERIEIILSEVSKLDLTIVFPVHPRTRKVIEEYNLIEKYPLIRMIEPVGYIENIALLENSIGLITDSGGMQKEAYFLKKKCITVRSETEWVDTLAEGWNTLLFSAKDLTELKQVWDRIPGKHYEDLYGDGNASVQITNIINKELS
tara:strand:+ start:200 stop:1246 length:1047 start_codon:yes stop_codon:yes gene_type:complete